MQRAATVALLLVLALPGASASVVRDTLKEHDSTVPSGAGADVPFTVPFHLEAPGLFYAKLLVTPWNAVNPGTPNGTVKPDHSAGTSGWWIEFYLADSAGAPLAVDGNGASVNPALGAFVDSTPTPTTFLAAGTPYALQGIVHVPVAASVPGARYEVNLALVYREGTFTGDGASGGRLEQSKAFTERIAIVGSALPPSGTPPTPGTPTAPTTPTPPATPTGPTPGPVATPTLSSSTPVTTAEPDEVVSARAPSLEGPWMWLFGIVAVVALAASTVALSVAAYVLLLVRREFGTTRARVDDREGARADDDAPAPRRESARRSP